MGAIYDDLADHEGYPAQIPADSTHTSSSLSRSGERVAGYLAACSCGWAGTTPHPATDHGHDAALAEWDTTHARPFLATAVPTDVAELVLQTRRAVNRLAADRPQAAAGVLRDLKSWIRALEPATRARDHLDQLQRTTPTRGAGRGR